MSKTRFKYVLLSILTVVFVLVIFRPIQLAPDSEGYLNMDIYRSAGYPIFLWILKQISGNHLNLVTVIAQITIGLVAIYIFITGLKRNLKLHPIWFLILSLIIATPYIYNHNVANNYLSEALSYPLYLMVVLNYMLSFIKHSKKHLLLGLFILFFLIQTRSQFMFLIPIGLLILTWIAYQTKSFKSNSWVFLLLIIFPILTFLGDKTFHKIVHGHFVSTPWTGIHIIAPAFYVSDETDFTIYENEDERAFFTFIFNELKQKKLNIHHLDLTADDDEASYYIKNFTNIANHTIYDDGKKLLAKYHSQEETFIAVDSMTKKMTLPLVMDNFTEWLKVYIKNFLNAFENSRYASLYFLILIFSLVGLFKYKSNTYKILSLTTLVTIANVALVALGMYTLKRFIFYNDWVIFLVIFILMDSFNKKQLKE